MSTYPTFGTCLSPIENACALSPKPSSSPTHGSLQSGLDYDQQLQSSLFDEETRLIDSRVASTFLPDASAWPMVCSSPYYNIDATAPFTIDDSFSFDYSSWTKVAEDENDETPQFGHLHDHQLSSAGSLGDGLLAPRIDSMPYLHGNHLSNFPPATLPSGDFQTRISHAGAQNSSLLIGDVSTEVEGSLRHSSIMASQTAPFFDQPGRKTPQLKDSSQPSEIACLSTAGSKRRRDDSESDQPPPPGKCPYCPIFCADAKRMRFVCS